MSRVRGFFAFLYDFVVGDDPWVAVLVGMGLGATGIVAGAGAAAWWVLPAVVLVALGWSVVRAGRTP